MYISILQINTFNFLQYWTQTRRRNDIYFIENQKTPITNVHWLWIRTVLFRRFKIRTSLVWKDDDREWSCRMGVTCRRVVDQVPQSHIAWDSAWVTDKRGRRLPDLAFSNCFGKKLFLGSSRLPPIDLRCALRIIPCWKAGRRLKSNEKIITGHKGLHSYLLLGWLPPWQDCARPNNPPQGLVAQTARAKIQGHPRSVDHLCLRYELLFILFVRATFYGSLLIGSSEGKF